MIPRVGVDLVPLTRARAITERHDGHVVRRMFSTREQTLLCRAGNVWDVEALAGRLAAKEAVFKLLSAADALPWSSIEILPDDGRRPTVHLGGRAAVLAARAGLGPIDVSITHDGDYAIAVAAATASLPPRKAES